MKIDAKKIYTPQSGRRLKYLAQKIPHFHFLVHRLLIIKGREEFPEKVDLSLTDIGDWNPHTSH